MCRLLETIKVKNKKLYNRPYHEARMNHSRKKLLGVEEPLDLSLIRLPEDIHKNQVYKCRIVYSREIEEITFTEYYPKEIRSLQIVRDDHIDYSFKYLDRKHLENLKSRSKESEEIIIIKNGWVTDSTYSNLVFFDGDKWVTPSTPLLKGTKRACYLDRGIIREAPIRESDIFYFQKVCLINAMLDIEDEVCVEVSCIQKP
ncbi:MAG: aminotransferase class IV [Bacteroidales bacterium]|nr:aminotransferase class IV [Bacteroidales bacterium]MCF8332986.1 aminotransferase class IV [Bacteroidales bacterium]